jgi:hypothetical protein
MTTRKRQHGEIGDKTAVEKTPEDQQLDAIAALLRVMATKRVSISHAANFLIWAWRLSRLPRKEGLALRWQCRG